MHDDLVDWPALDPASLADPSADWFASHAWFDTLARHAAPAGLQPGAVLAEGTVLPVWQQHGVVMQGMSSPYTVEYAPILPADAREAGRRFARHARRHGAVRLDALDPARPGLASFLDGIATAGIAVRRFGHFGNRTGAIVTHDFDGWLSTRPGSLRSTITRKLKRARDATRFDIVAGEAGLDAGIAAFEAVYAASWKVPEPFPAFNAACMRALSTSGCLRLGVLSTDAGPVAAQYWAVSGGSAMLLKLAHDQAASALSPGTVLTARMLDAILAADRPATLDFGRGDDPYKQLWVDGRRERIGVMLFNPYRPAGLTGLLRDTLGTLRRRQTQVD